MRFDRTQRKRQAPESGASVSPEFPECGEITAFLRELRFRHRVIGGADEADVWDKIEQLNRLYEKALDAERIRYDVLLAEALRKQPHRDSGQEEKM